MVTGIFWAFSPLTLRIVSKEQKLHIFDLNFCIISTLIPATFKLCFNHSSIYIQLMSVVVATCQMCYGCYLIMVLALSFRFAIVFSVIHTCCCFHSAIYFLFIFCL